MTVPEYDYLYLHTTKYFPYAQRYLLRGELSLTSDQEPQVPHKAYLLAPNGEITTLIPPPELWRYARWGGLQVMVTRIGVLWQFNGQGKAEKMTGLYRKEGDHWVRFMNASHMSLLSPDGCRLFHSRSFGLFEPGGHSGRGITNLCGGINNGE